MQTSFIMSVGDNTNRGGVYFSPGEKQTYGFDEKTQSTLGGYNQTQINGENHWLKTPPSP